MKIKLLMFAIVILVLSCHSENGRCVYYSGDLLREHEVRIKIREIDSSSGVIYRITDDPTEGTYFGSYEFRDDGSLKSYKFFGNDSAYTFNE